MPYSCSRTSWRLICAAALALAFCLVSQAGSAADGARPNIVFILTDDEDVGVHQFMPKTKALIEDQGTKFTNFFVSYPFCCPSRASILRGQYAHNTGVVGNELPYGGYEKFHALGREESTLATWLRAAGYHTAMIGKYLNRYVPHQHEVPPGWRDWFVGGNAHESYNYRLNENGRVVEYGDRPEDYLNDVLTRKAVDIIRRSVAAREPFFLYVLPYTPHSPSVAAPRHAGMFADARMPRTAAFDEIDVSDKPAFIRNLSRLSPEQIAAMEDEYRRRLRSLQAVDDMVEILVRTLDDVGELDNTYIVYSSDNGFHLGSHRLPAGKDFPYDEDIRVPMVMRGPGVPQGAEIHALVTNIDFAPTFAEIAGVPTPDFVDGRSFLPLLEDPDQPWRQAILIERSQFEFQYERLAYAQGLEGEALERTASFRGLRTRDTTYVEYGTGERELYDLTTDPLQLSNLAPEADPTLLAALSARTAELAACAAEECRRLEDLPPLSDFHMATQEPLPLSEPATEAPAVSIAN